MSISCQIKWQLVELSSSCMCDINPNFSSYRGVHHFLYLKYCPAVNIFQNFCQPVAIWAVIHFWSKSTTSRKQFVLHLLQMFVIFFTSCHFFDIWSTPQSCVGCCLKERNRRSVNLAFCPWFVICTKFVISTITFPNLFSFKLWLCCHRFPQNLCESFRIFSVLQIYLRNNHRPTHETDCNDPTIW